MYEDDDVEDGRADVINAAIKNNLGSKEDIQLYEHLLVALDLMQDEKFEVDSSNINNGINFIITTQYPNGLPEKVGMLFFNIDTHYDVECKENTHTLNGKMLNGQCRFYIIKIKKH